MRRKALSFLLALVLTMSVANVLDAAAMSAALIEPDDIIGIWYLNRMESEGVPLDLSEFGMVEITMDLSADNTAILDSPWDVVITGVWVITDGQIRFSTDDGLDIVFTFTDGNLCMNEDEVTMVFGKEKADTETKPEAKGILLDVDRVNYFKVGQSAYLSLSENRTTPIWWECDISDNSVMALDYDQYIMDDNPHDYDDVGGAHWYTFTAVSPGECTIRMLLGRISGDEEPYQVITYTVVVEEDLARGSVMNVEQGEVFSVTLDENQSIPYRWEAEISDGSLIKLIREEIDTSGFISDDSEPMPGKGGEKHVFYFKALRTGECTIDMNWADIRDGTVAQTESYRIIIEQ